MVRRGFDPAEVMEHVRSLDTEIERLHARLTELERELGLARRPLIDLTGVTDEMLRERVGEETVRELTEARESAALVQQRAEDEAVRIVAAAYEEASRVREAVQQEVVYLQRTTAEQVETELASARGRGLEMVTEAREYRERVLSDLAQRRELAREQIRALIDGRDHLLRAFEVARLTAVDIIVELEQAAPTVEDQPLLEAPPERDSGEPNFYDGAADLTPIAGIEIPVSSVPETSGPVRLEAIAGVMEDDSTLDEHVDGDLPHGASDQDEASDQRADADAPQPSPQIVGPFHSRALALTPITESMVKQVRRIVVDEQNDVLTSIRRAERVGAVDELLPGEDEHIERYCGRIAAELSEAFVAGVTSLGGAPDADQQPVRAAVLGRIAEELVLPMRERLERVIESSNGNRFELSAFVRSAYRELKQHFEELAQELAILAHGYGAYSALAHGDLVIWQPDPSATACAEAAANVGVITRVPDSFPSGHQHPPASRSCRCMIQRLPE
jgi:hypothetical protein